MESLAKMKSHLAELEEQKNQIEDMFRKANQRLKICLWGLGIGIVLLRLYWWAGVVVTGIALVGAIVYALKQSSFHDKLETIETEIHKLEISMA